VKKTSGSRSRALSYDVRSLGRLSASREPRHDASVTRRTLIILGLALSGEGYRHRASARSLGGLCRTTSHANMFTNASKSLAMLRAAPSGCPRRIALSIGTINSKVSNRSNFHSIPAQRQTYDSFSNARAPRYPCRLRNPSQITRRHMSNTQNDKSTKKHLAVIALGSNMGDRVAMIERACREMESNGKIEIKRTSSLWESKAMYVVDQDNFVNGACEVC
jgi:hypothetical protein